MRIKILFITALLLCSGLFAWAQDITVKGQVTDASNGSPVPFAAIQIKGTMTGASTDADGYWSMTVPENAVLVFSSIGYLSSEVPVAGNAVLNVTLSPDTQLLDETIVVAFGTSTKESFTGSASVVKSTDIAKVQSSNVTRSLEGVVAGVQMTTASGTLESSPSIIIRGISSINAGSDPLYIVDGVPFSGDLNNLNPNDIESMTVLKDAASNALYGARGANGVIMITTKKAKAGDAVVNIDAKWGWNSRALRTYDIITDPGQYYEAYYLAAYNDYVNAQGYSPEMANAYANRDLLDDLAYQVYTVPAGQNLIGLDGKLNPQATLGNMYTDANGQKHWLTPDNWLDEAYRNSLRQEYNISVSGSSERASFYASFGYLNNKGIINGSDMYRYSARLKADYQAKSWLKVGANMSYTNYNYNSANSDEGVSNSSNNVFAAATRIAPIYPLYVKDEHGNIMQDSHGWNMYDYGMGENGPVRPSFYNSNALQTSVLDKINNEGNSFSGTAFVDISFLRDFKFTFNAGAGLDESRGTQINNPYYGQFASNGGIIAKAHARNFYYNLQQLLNWDRTFGQHHVSVLLGHEFYNSTDYSISASRSMLLDGSSMELNEAIIDSGISQSFTTTYNNEGFFVRGQYDFANKVFVSASYRRDASSKFHPDHRWGDFWSLGGAWIISDEPWFRASWLDMLKLKASIGSQGNDNIPNYLYVDTWSLLDNAGQPGISLLQKGNEEITWETNTNFNTGVDFSMFAGRLSGTVEYFYRKTSDMLYFFTLPQSIGYGGYYDNVGDMRNSGIEVSLNGNLMRTKNFNWDMYLNFTHYTNKVLRIPDENKTSVVEGHGGYASGSYFIGEGLPLNTFYMPVSEGVDHTTGQELWRKNIVNDEGEIIGTETTSNYSEATYYLCADPTPKLYGGFGTSLEFFGFDVSVAFTYSIGGLVYDSGYSSYMTAPDGSAAGYNFHKDVFKAWTPDNPDSEIPRFQLGDMYSSASSDRFLTDASYLNFQNAQIGYTIPAKITQKMKISRLRVYVTCDNIVYWSVRQGLDPRYSFSGTTNYAINSPMRTLSGGINITF